MNFEFLTLLIAALITAGFLFWIEFANRKVKERTRANKNNRTKISKD